jgi:hypothetical protein
MGARSTLPSVGDDALRRRVSDRLLTASGAGSWRDVHPYAKWQGALWRLVTVIDLDVDAADTCIDPMVEVVLDWLVSDRRRARQRRATVDGRVRWCGTQEGLGLWAATALGRADDARVGLLAERLAAWQWPDGGWNCDKRPEVTHSSFHETHGPLRGLAAYHQATGEHRARRAARNAARFLLAHRLYRSCRTGRVAHPELIKLHWPAYWHYDVLVGLRCLDAVDMLADLAATDALDVIAAARQPDGAWRTSGRRYWKRPGSTGSNVEVVDLAPVAHTIVTAQAAHLLQRADRQAPTRGG